MRKGKASKEDRRRKVFNGLREVGEVIAEANIDLTKPILQPKDSGGSVKLSKRLRPRGKRTGSNAKTLKRLARKRAE